MKAVYQEIPGREGEYSKVTIDGKPAFDKTVQSLGACALLQKADGSYETDAEGNYTLWIFENAGFIKFAITNQGYGTIVQ